MCVCVCVWTSYCECHHSSTKCLSNSLRGLHLNRITSRFPSCCRLFIADLLPHFFIGCGDTLQITLEFIWCNATVYTKSRPNAILKLTKSVFGILMISLDDISSQYVKTFGIFYSPFHVDHNWHFSWEQSDRIFKWNCVLFWQVIHRLTRFNIIFNSISEEIVYKTPYLICAF